MCKSSKKPTIICISGKAGAGKDTCATFAKNYLEQVNKKVLVVHYADLLKYICKTFCGWDGNKDEAGRSLLQHIGIDVIKHKRPTYLIDFIHGILDFFPDKWEYVIIPDTRLIEEVDIWKDYGYRVVFIRVTRDTVLLTGDQANHITETALDGTEADWLIENTATLSDLENQTIRICNIVLFKDIFLSSL